VGQRGPHPKPKLAGRVAPGRARLRKGVPDRPAELTGEAAREWGRVAAELDAAGLIAHTDRGVLAAYCLAYADMLAARDAINRDGRFLSEPVQTSTGKLLGSRTREHPAVKLLERASGRLLKLSAELGLTPASRQRIEGDGGGPAAAGNRVLGPCRGGPGRRNGGH
jgi:P27 family predicted phage terminase small subunit